MSGSFFTALVALVGVATPAVATRGWSGGWNQAPHFDCPGQPHKPAPVCSSQQQSGWDWTGYEGGYGSVCSQYDSMSFSCRNGGAWKYVQDIFSSSSDFAGRGLAARTGRGCMSADLNNFPSYSCSGGRTFDAASFLVVSEIDVDLELVFEQADGTSCSQYSSCSRHGSTIANTQCANATSVTFKHRHGGGSCGFGVSSVSYASCTSTTTFPPPPSTSSYVSTTTYSVPSSTMVTTTSSTPSSTSTSSTLSTSTYVSSTSSTYSTPSPSSSTSLSTSTSTSVYTSTTPVVSTTTVSSVITTSSVSTVVVTYSQTITSCDSTVTNCPASSTVVSTSVSTSLTTIPVTTTVATVTTLSTSTAVTVTTMYVTTSTTICPVTATQKQGNSTVYSTYMTTSYVPVTITTTTTATSAPAVSSSSAVSSSTSSYSSSSVTSSSTSTVASPSSTGCPDTVPQCLNTWLYMVPDCKDNTDAACFCANANYTQTVISCLEAYSGDDMSTAISYLQGICAPHAGTNPQPFTGVPSTITVTAPAGPQTTVYITQSGTTSTVTVPAVTFSTPSGPSSSGGANLVPAGSSGSTSTIPIVPAGSQPTSSASSAAAATSSVGAPVIASSSVASVPASSSPAVVTGAGSKSLVSSSAVALVAMIVAMLL